jgi:hypothetical protein
MKAKLATAAFALSIVLAVPALLIDFLFALNTINPFNSFFVTDFQVRNDSGGPVRIWVAGTDGRGLRPLPLYLSGGLAIPAFRSGSFPLEAGNATTITYDWDDINFTLILVRAPSGEYLVLPVDTDTPRNGCCFRNEHDLYVIPPLRELRQASAEEREAILAEEWGSIRLWAMLAICFVLPIVPVYLWRVRRRLRPGRFWDQEIFQALCLL